LSKEITAVTTGYERQITKNDKLYLWLRAARDVTYADGHHELEQLNAQMFPATGDKPDQIVADRAMYDEKTGMLQCNGNVQIERHDGLKVKTDSLQFNQDTKIGETSAPVSFERENVSGQSVGALVDNDKKRLELKSNVAVTVAPEEFKKEDSKDQKPLKAARSKPVNIHAAHATFDQATMRLTFSGGATAEQEQDIMSGDTLTAILSDKKKLEKIEMRGNSYVRTMDPGHAAEAHSIDMDFYLDSDQRLTKAYGARDVRAQSLNADSDVQLTGSDAVTLDFQAQGDQSVLKEMRGEGGRSVATMSVPKSKANDPRAASKRLTADAIKMDWRTNGKDLEHAEAVGNAELYVEPVQQTAKNDRKTLTGPRFDCEFFESGNIAKTCAASGGGKAVFDPFQPTDKRGTQTLTAQKLMAIFVRETQDIEKVEAAGDAKFHELDRNGTANNIAYTAADETVRLRGGDPTVWDSRARTKATEIDSNNATHVSVCRGKVATTYYSQEQTNGATPFRKVKSPVYISGERAEIDHDSGRATYNGNARLWQDDNYVRGDSITLYREEKRMESWGHVQSALYQAKQKTGNSTNVVPVFATAEFMRYSDPERLLHYENNVDIKQGTDRMSSAIADVYLQKDTNEVERTVCQKNVVIVQPNRRGTGDWCEYTTANEVAVLTGNPAHVEDAEQGTTDGNRVTMYRLENRVVVDDTRGSQSPGRVRSTHKITKP
ncbi:MAG TPA: LPS export ABC transporter periplasmic protein LptC, partial [Pyrinomonadaceae bacterium]|nr:LPS export ABC transporter periplasmic protein LptC [Pyrinomonadaceae bacterium]